MGVVFSLFYVAPARGVPSDNPKEAETMPLRAIPFILAATVIAAFGQGHGESYDVRISSSNTEGTSDSSGPDFLIKKGFDLATLLAMLYATEPNRIVLPPELSDRNTHYDLAIHTPAPVDQTEMRRRMREGVEKHFGLTKSVEHRQMDVYVMTAIPGKLRPIKTAMGMSNMTLSVSSGEEPPEEKELQKAMETATMTEIFVSGDMKTVRRLLERGLHRPVIDETGLKGEYDVNTVGHAKTNEEFLQKLKDQAGLAVTPARRAVDVLIFTKR
jgi:uncharacterized protein (TIGR03435 family)